MATTKTAAASEMLDALTEIASEAAWRDMCATHVSDGPHLEWPDVPEPARRLMRRRHRAALEAVLPVVGQGILATLPKPRDDHRLEALTKHEGDTPWYTAYCRCRNSVSCLVGQDALDGIQEHCERANGPDRDLALVALMKAVKAIADLPEED